MHLPIEPIRLLAGSHADTGTTGKGCFMNVVAYLNGEQQITDKSPCVCVVVRPIVIWLNDFGLSNRFSQTQRLDNSNHLLQFVERAMGSATTDPAELSRRAWLAVGFAKEMQAAARRSAAAASFRSASVGSISAITNSTPGSPSV